MSEDRQPFLPRGIEERFVVAKIDHVLLLKCARCNLAWFLPISNDQADPGKLLELLRHAMTHDRR